GVGVCSDGSLVTELAAQLFEEPGLARARLAGDEHDRRPLVAHDAPPRGPQERQVVIAPDKRRLLHGRRLPGLAQTEDLEDRDGVALALEGHGPSGPEGGAAR